MTYKILFNDAVAMTGGQPHEGNLTVDMIAAQVRAEGVERIAVVSRRAGQIRRASSRSRPARRCTIATTSTTSSASCARSRASRC